MANGSGSSINVVEKFQALSMGEKIILIAGPVLFIISFLPWYHASFGSVEVAGQTFSSGGSISRSGWQSPGAIWSIFAMLIGLAMSGVIIVKSLAKEGTLPDNISGISWPKIMLGAAGVAALFIVIKLISESSHLGFGFFLGIIAVGALVAGAALMYRDEMSGSSPQG